VVLPSSVGALSRARKAEGQAPASASNPADYTRTEYSTEYVDHGKGQTMDLVKHPDHGDIFHWRNGRTGKSSYRASYNFGTSVHDPSYSRPTDYSYGRPEPDPTKHRHLEQIVDVNPFRPQHRQSQKFRGTSTYRHEFRNFFPTVSGDEHGRLADRPATVATASRSITFGAPEVRATTIPQINPFPFDIESRQVLAHPTDDPEMNSTYRQDFIDFDNPPQSRTRSLGSPLTTMSWADYKPDKNPASEPNPFDFSVRGKVRDCWSTNYRDNYVDFMQREEMRPLDDED
jgi:hypothetical protein